jgi:hypothetical protein
LEIRAPQDHGARVAALPGRARGGVLHTNRPEIFQGLVQPEESERILNGYRLPRVRPLDPEQQFERGHPRFPANAFVLLAGGRQVETLDEEIDLETADGGGIPEAGAARRRLTSLTIPLSK